jgi:pyruvate/2-oxoacid:ferredoxin oxidoreductase beta subunit
MEEQDFKIIEAMEEYGGSFVQALAACLRRADPFNFQKLKIAFPEYFKEYEEISKRKKI